MAKRIPIIVLWDDIVFPSTTKELIIDKDYNLRACSIAQKEFDSQVVVVGVKKESTTDNLTKDKLLSVGVLCQLSSFAEINENGILKGRAFLDGLRRVKIKTFQAISPHTPTTWVGEIVYLRERKLQLDTVISVKRRKGENALNLNQTKDFLKKLKESSNNLESFIDRAANNWPSNQPEMLDLKKEILCSPSIIDRIKTLISIECKLTDVDLSKLKEKTEKPESMEEIIDEQITKKVTKNINRQQKEFYLREKMKVIKEELGDASSKEAEIKKIKFQLKTGRFPQHVINKVNEEIQRLEMCSSYSNEATVIRSYLDWLLNLPWKVISKDETDLKKVKSFLDASHYGLEKIKDRILEFLAVKKKSEQESGTIICFVGPPGVGKTSLARSIAEALNKKFVKISLGGLYDEAELRGHRRTYVASLPGKIIRALRQAKVKNPVFLLDEIDKVAGGYHGDPVHALLEILDPKQNTHFNDHYIEEDFDLSKVMFIATANNDENIPDPLWDRMEVIYLRTYTETEKLNIAKSHLVPEVLKSSGLKPEELSFTDESLTFIIQRYTREAGVRNLKKQIEKIARKVVKEMIVEEPTVSLITPVEVKKYLEYELFDVTMKDEMAIPGVVNGMAYTECGGDLLPIEVNHVSGKGNLSLTGNLKDTMKESATVALAYVRANEEAFGLKEMSVDWNNIDVNLHVPTGGTPKDGPSAGVTITTAIISSFSGKPVSPKVAMTGEITLRGKVLPIGGLREKVVSAVRGGVDTIFYPEENTKNLVDIPEDVKEKITLVPVKHYTDIFSRLF